MILDYVGPHVGTTRRGPLRFKTEEEFILFYGPNWRYSLEGLYTWVGSMDSMFGKPLSEFGFMNEAPLYGSCQINGWYITEQMVTYAEIQAFTLNTTPLLNYRDYSTIIK